jgi:uncharacterized repeat protein (TIGR01451 family)
MTGHSRFTGGLLATLALAGTGVASGRPTLFVAAVVPLVFVLYGAVSVPTGDESIHVTRSFSTDSPLPGDRVTVTVAVENRGDGALPDVRVVDGVPADVRVVEGTPDAALALPDGGTATVEYTVVADRGQFPFDPVTARVRGTSAAAPLTLEVPADGATQLDCRVSVADIPLRRQTTAHAGTLPTDAGGPGIEFHSTRDYQRGDPASRINWRRYAKTGELSTVNYRERRAAAVVLAVDARAESDVAARSDTPSGASLSAYAAAQAVEPLEGSGHQVGLAVFGVEDPATGTNPAWVAPGTGDAHHARIATVLDAAVDGPTDPEHGGETEAGESEASGTPDAPLATADGGSWLDGIGGTSRAGGAGQADNSRQNGDTGQRDEAQTNSNPRQNGDSATGDVSKSDERAAGTLTSDALVGRFLERVDPGTQVVVCSPALDDFPAALARRLAADGHRVTAVSPDVTATGTPGRTLVAADRALALSDLRAVGARVVDWAPDESLASAVSRAKTAVEEGSR